MTHPSDPRDHPDPTLLERFMRNEVAEKERRWIVRHLIAGCSRCVAVTGRLWSLGDPPAEPARPRAPMARAMPKKHERGEHPQATVARLRVRLAGLRQADSLEKLAETADPAAAKSDPFERLAEVGRRIEEEREQAPRLAAVLLADSPAAGGSGARPAGIRPAFLTPAVCDVLLDRSREAGPSEPAVALQAADLALAIAERLDPEACGATVARALRVRAWAHVAQARRLGDDLDGAEWALAVAEALASGIGGRAGSRTGAPPLEPAEWAELLVFKAGLFADRGDLRGADRLLGRAAELFEAGGDPQRAGRTLAQEGLIRAELGDRQRAAELLRAGVDLLDPAADPSLVAANLYRLATLLRGIAMEATPTAMTGTTALTAMPAAGAATTAETGPGQTAEETVVPRAAAAPRTAGAPIAIAAHACGTEALQLVARARALYRELGDSAAEAHLWRLQGQIEVALGRLEDAERTLLAATAALASHGLGREAALAQLELALVLLRQGRTAEIHRLGLDLRPVKYARDKSWPLEAAQMVFQVTALDPAHLAHPGEAVLLAELARYLAPRSPQVPAQPHGPRHHRLDRVA
ncbi:MAG: hypothetical protein JOZ15_16345 [Acidobacteria bacterium]|nr:hypothetical protein [Acidobacteriota bacterium]